MKLNGDEKENFFVLRSKYNIGIQAWLYDTFMNYSVLAPKSNVVITTKENDIVQCKLLALDDTQIDNIKYYITVHDNRFIIEISSNDFHVIDQETFKLLEYCKEVGTTIKQKDEQIYIGFIGVYVDKEDIVSKFTDKNLAKII